MYEELNDVELEHTSMILDMSIVPPEVQFTSREIKDVCTGVSNDSINNSYKPPDFVVNALQHTNVECSWGRDSVLYSLVKLLILIVDFTILNFRHRKTKRKETNQFFIMEKFK